MTDKWLITWDGAPTSSTFYRRLAEITGAREVQAGERLPAVEAVLSNVYVVRDRWPASWSWRTSQRRGSGRRKR